jgi:hypothetical protein
MKWIFYLIIFLFSTSTIFAQKNADSNQLSRNSSQLRFKIFLIDGGVFHGSTMNKKIYIVTEFARIKLRLSEVDSVEIGILPDYHKEKRILKLIKQLYTVNEEDKSRAYKKLISMNIGALPVIRNYIVKDTVHGPQSTDHGQFNAVNVLKELVTKYKVSKDFMDRDIVYMHSGFKMRGIFTLKKKRAFIKFGRFVFLREEMRKIVFE